MSLNTGARIGPYEIVAPLGAGGMGEVYRAHDVRLKRDVAIKALPLHFRDEPSHAARLQREAHVLAALNHPHIAAIYGIEETESATFLILELVDGETLAERLEAGPLPVSDAVTIARQVADALEGAHERGIIHRDLKPANIALTADGRVKVLDFGVAKVVDAAIVGDSSSAVAATRTGDIVGTSAYMSPEQMQGLAVDRRTDIWAFGCVLYEMLTGHAAFGGSSIVNTMAAVLSKEPNWSALPSSLPARLRWLVRRCLVKNPKHRLHDIADARLEMEDVLSGTGEGLAADFFPVRSSSGARRLAWLGAGTLMLMALGLIAVVDGGLGTGVEEAAVYRSSVLLPEGQRFVGQPAGRFALSPDGQRIALIAADSTGRTRLWLRRLDGLGAQPLLGTEGAAFPFWSPDSRLVAFFAQGKLMKIDVDGGQLSTICDAAFQATGTWNEDDVILFTPTGESGLHRVPASGGTPVPVTTLDRDSHDSQHIYPFFLPDGERFLYLVRGSATGGVTDPRGIYVGSLNGGEPGRLLVEGGSNAKYAQGYLIFLRGTVLMAQRLDMRRMELRGEEHYIAENTQFVSGSLTGGAGAFTVSQNGVIAYQTGLDMTVSELAWYDRAGTRLATLGSHGDYGDVSLSPDNTHLAVSRVDTTRWTSDVWTVDLSRGLMERFTAGTGDEFAPAWSPDGLHIAFSSRQGSRFDLQRKMASGVGSEETLIGTSLGKFQSSWSPDGQTLAFVVGGSAISRSDIWVMPVGLNAQPSALFSSPSIETHAQFSPDGEWIAYSAGPSLDELEVYVTPFPGPGPQVRVSPAGGGWPRWRRDGDEIFYLARDNTLTVASISLDDSRLSVTAIRPLFPARPRPFPRLDAYPYDVSSDGQRFMLNDFVRATPAPPVTLVVNWTAGIHR